MLNPYAVSKPFLTEAAYIAILNIGPLPHLIAGLINQYGLTSGKCNKGAGGFLMSENFQPGSFDTKL